MTHTYNSAAIRTSLTDRVQLAGVLIARLPSRAVSMSTFNGIPNVLGVWPGRFDHQVESTGAADVARIAVRLIRRDELGLVEVARTINALDVAVMHQEHAHIRKPNLENSTS